METISKQCRNGFYFMKTLEIVFISIDTNSNMISYSWIKLFLFLWNGLSESLFAYVFTLKDIITFSMLICLLRKMFDSKAD